MKSAKQIGLNTWKLGAAVIVRDAGAFRVAGVLPRQSAVRATLADATTVAREFDKAATARESGKATK